MQGTASHRPPNGQFRVLDWRLFQRLQAVVTSVTDEATGPKEKIAKKRYDGDNNPAGSKASFLSWSGLPLCVAIEPGA